MDNFYQIFGSADSQDVDIMVFVDELKSIDENHTLIKKLNQHFQESLFPNRDINCNLGIVKNGMLIDVFKGTYDECNNSLYYTYGNHYQHCSNKIQDVYDRSRSSEFYHIKLKRVARFILSFFSREPELREFIKPALRGDLIERLQALQKIDFQNYITFPGKKEKHEDIYKVCAFQFVQCICLAANREIYTKTDVKTNFIHFSNIIDRKYITKDDLANLNSAKEIFITQCEAELESGRLTNLKEI